MSEKIAFITYETPFAKCGGVAAVMGRLPGYVQNESGLEVAVITPFHHRIGDTASKGRFTVEIGVVEIDRASIKILRYEEWSHIGDLQNPVGLIEHLRDKNDPFSCFIVDEFPVDIRQRLSSYNGGSESIFELAQTIVMRLDLVIKGPSIYRKRLFEGRKLSEFTIKLANGIQATGSFQLLNYMLLHESYPDCIPAVRMWPWYFLDATLDGERKYFRGYPHSYALDDRRARNAESLSHDAMFFGKAVAESLPVIDGNADWILLMQDWEGAATALALNGQLKRYKSFIVLHNSYDSFAVAGETGSDLQRPLQPAYDSILREAIARVNRPVFTVSGQFALDLTTDPIQVHILARHLQDCLRSGLIGVNNGPFEKLHVPADICECNGDSFVTRLRDWKAEKRKKAIVELRQIVPGTDAPVWGEPSRLTSGNNSCWFVMVGRDDPRQKGYDVAAAAARRVLTEAYDACFIFCPIPGDEGLPGLSFLKQFAQDFPGRVVVLPFRLQEGYFSTLSGASYGIIPSFYEPFGGVGDFYLNGTPGIARATGGLMQQIVPCREIESFNSAVRYRTNKWQSSCSASTGLLFRERDGISSVTGDWECINQAEYDIGGGPNDRVGQRMRLSVFKEMVNELFLCIKDATNIYFNRQDFYYRLIKNGIDHIQNSLSWERTARDYVTHILKR